MSSKKAKHISSLRSFSTFLRHFLHYCSILRVILGIQFALILLCGVAFAWCEGIAIGQGVYFSLITSTTVGYGDITPKTGIGQCISVFLALGGTILFGLVVAVATQAFRVTIEEYWHVHGKSPSQS